MYLFLHLLVKDDPFIKSVSFGSIVTNHEVPEPSLANEMKGYLWSEALGLSEFKHLPQQYQKRREEIYTFFEVPRELERVYIK